MFEYGICDEEGCDNYLSSDEEIESGICDDCAEAFADDDEVYGE